MSAGGYVISKVGHMGAKIAEDVFISIEDEAESILKDTITNAILKL